MTDRFAKTAARLMAAARAIAVARVEELHAKPATRWRRAELVWPRFTRG